MTDPKESFFALFYSVAILALAGIPILLYWRSTKTPLLSQRGKWVVPWNGWAVLVTFVAMVFVPSIVNAILNETGFFRMLYGPDFPGPDAKDNPDHKQALHLRGLWSQTFAAPVIVALIVIGFHYGLKASAQQMGLSSKRWAANVALGYLGWLIIAPLAFIVFAIAIVLLTPQPDKHPLMDLGSRAGQVESIVFALQVAVLWPVVEELVFRGVLLSWLVQEPSANKALILQPQQRGHICIAAAILLTLLSPAVSEAIQARQWDRILAKLSPLLFIVALVPFYLVLPFSKWIQRRTGFSSPQSNQALFASAILFAAIHSGIWPTPIPLLVLGLGLGWLALRTRSIVPSIVVHALFNGVAVVYQRLGGMG